MFGKIKILRMVLRLAELLPLPDIKDSIELRTWLLKALGLLDELADQTETTADDAIVDALERIVNNDKAWNGLYSLVNMLLDKTDNEIEVLGATDIPTAAKTIGDEVGMDPVTIISLIMMGIKALKMFRKWRGK